MRLLPGSRPPRILIRQPPRILIWQPPLRFDPTADTSAVRRRGEAEGLLPPSGAAGVAGLRNNRRTDNLVDPAVSALVAPKLPEALLQKIEATAPHTQVTYPTH
eukprot:901004-Prymnesium_polylepis.1